MRKSLQLLTVVFIAVTLVYLWLNHRRASIIAEKAANTNLVFDNPSELELLVHFGEDSFRIPAHATVYFPVNDQQLASAPKHLRSVAAATNQTIVDSMIALSAEAYDYFINPSFSRYVRCSRKAHLLYTYAVDRSDGRNPDQPGETDSCFVYGLIIGRKNTRAPFEPADNEAVSQPHGGAQSWLCWPGNAAMQRIFYSERWAGFLSPERILEKEEAAR